MFQPLHLPRLAYVVRHMRRDDRREMLTRWRQDEQEFAQQLYEGTNFGNRRLAMTVRPLPPSVRLKCGRCMVGLAVCNRRLACGCGQGDPSSPPPIHSLYFIKARTPGRNVWRLRIGRWFIAG